MRKNYFLAINFNSFSYVIFIVALIIATAVSIVTCIAFSWIRVSYADTGIASEEKTDFDTREWKLRKPLLTIPGLGYTKVILDQDIDRESQDYQDIRVVTDKKNEIPYQVVQNISSHKISYHSSIHEHALISGKTEFVIDVGKDSVAHHMVVFHTPSKNYQRRVIIYSSHYELSLDDPNWQLLTSSGSIYNYTDEQSGNEIDNEAVYYPQSTERYLKIVIASGELPLIVGTAEVYKDEATTTDTTALTISAHRKLIQDSTSTPTENLVLDLGGSGISTYKLELLASSTVYGAHMSVLGSNDQISWNMLAQGYYINSGQIIFEYPEVRYRYIQLTVPVFSVASSVKVVSPTHSIVFYTDPKDSYYIYYGNSKASLPAYASEKHFQYSSISSLSDIPHALLGAQQINPDYSMPQSEHISISQKYPHFISVVITIVGIIIIFSIITLYDRA